MGKSNNLEDYTFEVKYSDNEELSKEKLRCFANYLLELGIKEGTIPVPPGYNNTNDITQEVPTTHHNNISREYVETPTYKDLIHSTGSFVSGLVPGVGELFNFLFTAPAMKRRDDWIQSIEIELLELQKQIPDILQRIQNNENAITAIMYASPLAIKTTNSKKLEALRNIIINTILYKDYEEYKTQMFLSFIDGFTEWHIRLLEYFSDPKKTINKYINNYKFPKSQRIHSIQPFWDIYPNMFNERQFLSIILDDLYSKNILIFNKKILTQMYDFHDNFFKVGHPYNKGTTNFGDEFLKFISNPLI